MADMADFALDQVMDAEDDRMAYLLGDMSDGEAFERGIIDERGGSNHPPMFTSSPLKFCAHCGCPNLHWRETPHGWRLHDSNCKIHTCKEYADTRPTSKTGPGTPSARLSWLLDELGKRVGEIDPYLSSPPEVELLKRLDAILLTRNRP
jgi:hypothetical protein